ncbi:uncharacterized protein BKCO1_2800051 [Diplodia corticola]|uniref:DUF427 domain-containing protein n=1 Tax=Diplodia corticola TaxID=236234 RepID=A0A1J9R087_9PEZI|nr:uncharacterized protein BKCO1_2800051 [Diplodia corticola]OJD33666.1 hypothetical protein BKCO1_2800051 [Diplodia corticola]
MPPTKPAPPADLATLAHTLLTTGPVRTLAAASKRIRVQLGGRVVADSTRALYVWEHPYYPYYYLPAADLAEGSWKVVKEVEGGRARILSLGGGGDGGEGGTTERVVAFGEDVGGEAEGEKNGGPVGGAGIAKEGGDAIRALRGMVRIEFGAADAWFEEDTRIDVHPKDPFKRVDVVLSMRPVRVFVKGTLVAHATSAYHLFETGLPPRYYLPPTSVDPGVLRPSATKTKCPYKGEAEYYDVVVGEEVVKDVVWFYRNPTQESALIVGALCFYNEKVDIELDGEMLERPKTLFG